jgi:hypothetical protein
VLEPRPAPRCARQLLRGSDVAELHAGLARSLVRGNAAASEVGGPEVEVQRQLLVHLALERTTMEQVADD